MINGTLGFGYGGCQDSIRAHALFFLVFIVFEKKILILC